MRASPTCHDQLHDDVPSDERDECRRKTEKTIGEKLRERDLDPVLFRTRIGCQSSELGASAAWTKRDESSSLCGQNALANSSEGSVTGRMRRAVRTGRHRPEEGLLLQKVPQLF